MADCAGKIEQILDNDPVNSSAQPYPTFYEDANCQGNSFPSAWGPQDHTFTSSYSSVIIPEGWTVTIDGNTFTDTFTQTDSTIDAIVTTPDMSQDELKATFCMGRYAAFFSTPFKNSYFPASTACDTFMPTYCNTPSTEDLPECSCFKEDKELKAEYPDLVLPVACFGETCRIDGYETAEMYAQDCTVPICQDLIANTGNGFTDNGVTNVTCGSRDFYIPDLPTVIPPDPTSNPIQQDTSTASWIIAVIMAGTIAIAILVALAIIYL